MNFDFNLDADGPKKQFLLDYALHFYGFCFLMNLNGFDISYSRKRWISLGKYGKRKLVIHLVIHKSLFFEELSCSILFFE
jgi:hypothetical protein